MFNREIMGIIGKDEGGFSLLEVMIASSIFALIMAAAFTMMAVGIDVEDSVVTTGDMEDRSRMVLERIIEELNGALVDTTWVTTANDAIVFQVNEGYDGVEVQESTVRELRFEYDTGEGGGGFDPLVAPAIDDDIDGMIDEGVVVRVVYDQVGAVVDRAVLTHWVKGYDYEAIPPAPVCGLFFGLIGDRLTIRLQLQRRDAKDRIVQSVSEVTMRIKN